ncbi:MAG: hypothetical protein KTR30_21300 [Saprospiraceae bacterium]|nr:hypothetical protein [Saprospiraceae bacterium]
MKSNRPLHTYAIIFIMVFSIANTTFAQGKSNTYSTTNSILKETACQPQIAGQHLQVFYRELDQLKRTGQPTVAHACGYAVELTSEDQYHMLGCQAEGLTNYFALDRWSKAKIKGDGGVDVTGAPNSMLVEGANIAQSKVPTASVQRFQIAIPAEGFISFDWRNIVGSNLFGIQVNEAAVQWTEQNTNFFSNPLVAGDLLTVYIPSGQNLNHYVSNFQFLTNAMGVLVRDWTATDEQGFQDHFTQLLSLDKTSLAQVFFPSSTRTTQKAAKATPKLTGFPVIDLDGNLGTTNDQYLLEEKDDVFDLSWTDELIQNKEGFFLQRTWVVEDWCSGSNLQKTQIIRLESGLQHLSVDQIDDATGLNLRVQPTSSSFSDSFEKDFSAPSF